MKKTEIMSLISNKDGNPIKVLVDAWETVLPGLYITQVHGIEEFSFTHARSGLSFFIEEIKTIKFGRQIAKEDLIKIDFTEDEKHIVEHEATIRDVHKKHFE